MPARVTKFFFDKQLVIDLIGKANADALGFTGSHIKRFAQTSMRYSKKTISSPGEPPRAHPQTGAYVRKRLFNWYDRNSKSMVIGPEKMNARGKDVPRILEKGGETTVMHRGASYRTTIEARPYMGPALEHELPLIPDRWANSIRGPQ